MVDPNTYIETEALISWGKELTKLNQEALDIINDLEEEKKRLLEKWNGNAANGFNMVINNLIQDARKYHNDMKSVERILNEVIITAENQ